MKNGHKKAIIPYHLLRKSPFDVPLNSFTIWISDKEASRIIQSHHVTYTNERFFRPRVETQLLIALFFLPFGTPDSGSKFRRYQVFMSYHWASAGMTKGNRLSKRKRNVLRRDDYFYFHHYSFQICITDQASGQYDWISIWLVSFLKVLQRFIESQRQKVTSKCAIVLLYWLYVIVAGRGLCSLHFASRRFQNHSLLRQL